MKFKLFTLLISSVVSGGSVWAAPISLKIHDSLDYSGELTLFQGEKSLAKFTLQGANTWTNSSSFEWPRAGGVTLKGTFKDEDRSWSSLESKAVTWEIVELEPLIKPLRDTSLQPSARLQAMLKAKEAFDKRYASLLEGVGFFYESGVPDATEKIKAAESKLGFELPAGYKQILRSIGASSLDDSYFMRAEQIDNSYEQMVKDWGTPREEMEKLSPEMKKFLKESVILFTEAGDGYGAVISKSSGSNPGFYTIHQDDMHALRLTNQNGSSKDFDQTLLWILANYAIQFYDDGDPRIVFLDHSSKVPFSYLLERDDTNEPPFHVRLEWDSFE